MSDNNGFVLKEHLFFEKKPFEDPYIEDLFKGCLSYFDNKRAPLSSLVKSLSATPVSEKETTYLLKSSSTSDLFKSVYSHIDFVPPQGVRSAAARGLELRKKAPKSKKGGLSVQQAAKEGIGSGVQRAVNLKNGSKMSPKVIRQMVAFFSRHAKNKAIDPGKSPAEDKGYQAWLLWGGDPGQAWANKVLRQMEAAEKTKKADTYHMDLFKRLDFSLMPQNPATGTIAEAKGTSYIYTKDARGGRWEKLKTPQEGKKVKIEGVKKRKKQEEDDEKKLMADQQETSPGAKVSPDKKKQIDTSVKEEEFKPVEKELVLKDGSKRKVMGEETGGLFIHKEVLQGGKRGAWIITHSASGMKLVDSFKSKKDSQTAATRLRNLEDWTKSLDDLKQTALFGEIKAFANKLRENPYAESTGEIKKIEDKLYVKKKEESEKRAVRQAKKKEKEERAERLKKEKQKGRPDTKEVKKSYVLKRKLKKEPSRVARFKVRRKAK